MTVIFHSHKMFFFVCLFVCFKGSEGSNSCAKKEKKKSTNYSTYIVILSAEARLETYLIPYIQLSLSKFSLYTIFLEHLYVIKYNFISF